MENLVVLIVDDEEDIQNILSDRLKIHGYQVSVASNGLEALEMVDRIFPDLILLDIRLLDPNLDGMELLARIKQEYPEIIVIMITAHGTIQIAVEAMKLGAYDFIEKPFNSLDEVRIKVGTALQRKAMIMENQYLRSELKGKYSDIIGKSPKIMEVLHNIDKVAPSDLTVLITGETGTGKELVAKALHENSLRSSKEFVVVNCTADTLFESYLFGHEKGSFTGAISRKPGKMDFAEGGTIFLDEIGDMPFDLQSKLLRLIQFKEFERVGGTLIKADVRFIAATNKDLNEAIQKDKFRLDLYHRINGVNIELPPLRQLKEDIPILIEYFIKKYNTVSGKQIVHITDEARNLMINYEWPGNIRELQRCIESMILLADREIISVDDLPQKIRDVKISESKSTNSGSGIFIKPGTALRNAEKMLILKTLKDAGGNKTKAAKLLGISLRGLQYKLDNYLKDQ
jgi:two-component system response regulator AtoC